MAESTQDQYGDLRIGVDDVRQERNPTASLWLQVRTDASKNREVVVHEGEIIRIDRYELTVKSIETGPQSVVRLRIEEAGQQ